MTRPWTLPRSNCSGPTGCRRQAGGSHRDYKDFVEVMKGYEKLAAAQKEAGRGTSAAVLISRAKRLEAEIQLERAAVKAVKKN